MPRIIIAVGLLFGVVANVSSADPIEKLKANFTNRLDAQVEELSSAIVSDAVAIHLGASNLQAGEPGSAKSKTTAGSGRGRCRVTNDRMLECTVLADAGAGRISAAGGPAAPAGN